MLTGSCLCGKLRYELRGTPMAMYYCHGFDSSLDKLPQRPQGVS